MDRTVEAVDLGGSFSGDMSMWGLFLQADLIVKAVMLLLFFASIWCWAIIFEKRSKLNKLQARANKFEDSFWSGEPLDKLYDRVRKIKKDPLINVFCAGMEEWHNGVAGGLPAKESIEVQKENKASLSLKK